MSNNLTQTANRLKRLRESLNLSQRKFGKLFNYSGAQISNIEKGVSDPTKFSRIVIEKYGENFGLEQPNQPQDKPHIYTQSPEKMIPTDKGGEPRPGSYGIPDLSQNQVTHTFQPENESYINMVRDILSSGQTGTVMALKSNIRAFYDQVHDKRRIQEMEAKIKALNKDVNKLKNITGGCAVPAVELPECENN